jgi:hypothetical protein
MWLDRERRMRSVASCACASPCLVTPTLAQWLYSEGYLYIYIYMCWPALGYNSWHFDIIVSILSWANAITPPPTHLLAFDCDSWVRLGDSSALIITLHLEALGGLFCCGISCYSWWLPPPRWLGAAVEVRHVLVIVRGWLRWLSCEGFLWFPVERRIPTLVDCSCHCNS